MYWLLLAQIGDLKLAETCFKEKVKPMETLWTNPYSNPQYRADHKAFEQIKK